MSRPEPPPNLPGPVRALVIGLLWSGIGAGCLNARPASPGRSDAARASPNMQRLAKGVFEIVTPKLEDGTVKYQIPLPVDLLPFRERDSKFWSVGTAFAISPDRFVTAAHVLTAQKSLHTRFFLLAASGASYEIGRITKYSQYRDLAEFELVSPPKDILPLARAPGARVGAEVVAVGNALAEGIVARTGTLVSFTPEEHAGKWQFLRFTAPASPGNSGGPLLDGDGRVLGVVVRKSDTENLNYAVPLTELDGMDSHRSEFWAKGVAFADEDKQLFADWKFETPLPEPLSVLRETSQRDYLEFTGRSLAELDQRYAGQMFPRDPNLATYLRAPQIPFGLGTLTVDRSGSWSISASSYKEKEVTPGQWANFASRDRYAEIILERPRGTSLLTFYQSPKQVADAIVRLQDLTRTFAGRKIPIESLGEPGEQERWSDELGRPWFTYVWHLGFADESVVLECLTNPAGLACEWNTVPATNEDLYRLYFKRFAPRTTLAYYGHIRDWEEFLALPDAYKPRSLTGKNLVVHFGKALALDIGGFRGSVEAPLLSEDSRLFVYVAPDVGPLPGSRFVEVRVKLRPDKAYRMGVERIFEPTPNSPEANVRHWNRVKTAEPPYDGALVVEGKESSVRTVRKPEHQTTPEVRYIYYCWSGPEDDKEELKRVCAAFNKALAVDEP